jgi:hypothetical protein
MRSNKELLIEAYRAFNSRDIDGVLALMSADVNWPKAFEGVRAVGAAEVRAYWTKQWEEIDPRVEAVSIEEEESGTVVDVHQVVRDLDGRVLLDVTVQHVYQIENGLITRMDVRERGSA